jgi:DNA-directed RNA polymerase subunit RPC12/RpoP
MVLELSNVLRLRQPRSGRSVALPVRAQKNHVAAGARMWDSFLPVMSEFKYACPVCGQHMKCDSSQSGTVMECPTCFQKITAPQAPESEDSKFIITGTKTGERPIPAAVANAGLTAPVPEAEKKSPVAAIALVFLLCAAAVMLFVFWGKIFKPEPPPEAAPGSNSVSPAQPAPVTYTLNIPSIGSDGNFALNKPAFASSQQGDHPVQNGNDGNFATRWCAADGNVPQWWEVDLGGAITITNTQVTWELVSIYQYEIKVSSDNINWTTVVDKTSNLTPAKKNSDDFSANGRYVRIFVTGLQPGTWASFFEFQVLGFFSGSGDAGSTTNGSSTNQP